MKKKQSKCRGFPAVKLCVFKVRSTGKQEMLQSRTLLSEQTRQIMLNNGLEQLCPVNVRNYSRAFDATQPSFSSQVHENVTAH